MDFITAEHAHTAAGLMLSSTANKVYICNSELGSSFSRLHVSYSCRDLLKSFAA